MLEISLQLKLKLFILAEFKKWINSMFVKPQSITMIEIKF